MQAIPILAYHSIADPDNARYAQWCVTPHRFHQHMSVLKQWNYRVFTISQLVDWLVMGKPMPSRCVAISFDDGLQDFQDNAVPILSAFDYPATLYVVAGLIGKSSRWLAPLGEGNRPILNASELRALSATGIEIGGHSMTHPELDVLDRSTAFAEIRNCKHVLEDVLGEDVRSFAYPHGYASDTTRQLAEDAGYGSAVRVRHALSATGENTFGLSRLVMTESLGKAELFSLLTGHGVPVAPPQNSLRSSLWRMTRRLTALRRQPRPVCEVTAS